MAQNLCRKEMKWWCFRPLLCTLFRLNWAIKYVCKICYLWQHTFSAQFTFLHYSNIQLTWSALNKRGCFSFSSDSSSFARISARLSAKVRRDLSLISSFARLDGNSLACFWSHSMCAWKCIITLNIRNTNTYTVNILLEERALIYKSAPAFE